MPQVREAIRLIEKDGWPLLRTRGSHRQYSHPIKPGLVTIPGHPSDDLPPGTWSSIMKQQVSSEVTDMKYAVVFEHGEKNFAAYVPDLPGCVSTGKTRDDVERNIRDAIEFHIDGLRLTGQSIPPASAWVETIDLSSVA